MTRKNVLIAVAVVLVGAARRRRELLFQEGQGPHGHDRRRSRPATSKRSCRRRARFSRSASSTSAPKRRAASSTWRSTKAIASRRVSSCCRSIRSRCAARVDGGTASLQAAEGVARADAAVGRDGARAARSGAAEPRAPARSLEAAADDARGAREGGERRQGGASRRCRSARSRSTPQASRISQERATLESARYDLSKVRIESPIDGIVTRRNIQEGETAVIGTMNNAGTVLLTLADMSVIQAEVEVDETNIPHVQLGQLAKITIDAIPDRIVQGTRHRDRQQPDSGAPGATAGTQATNFKVVVVLDERCPRCGRASPARPTSRPRRERTSSRCRFRRSRCASWSTTRTARS